ncbi:ATP-binding protein [Salmonella enterica]|nr:ATP-binding protein [Salmonella enterica]
MKQRLPFELDPQIIHHIIYSQAGSIGKAIIELLMNAIDAQASELKLTMTSEGFTCLDDGNGFASREGVLRYFGRFGTPHEDGDATYGRFRLGRGQIMAHASTIWQSKAWTMTVDTRVMGYGYDLEEDSKNTTVSGCLITGQWYEPMSETELLSSIQEIRDLVRYTAIRVELNGRQISKDPRNEKWNFEDDFAYYRVKEEGAVSIYNLGVLVRHDSSHQWGAGGLIVSKQALGLNISRTEILRKTCQVWKNIARQFNKMADELASKLGDHRKTEARREKSARALLAGDPNISHIFWKEEVVTVLPGKKHISMERFLRNCRHYGENEGAFTVVQNGFDVPAGEAIAKSGIALVVHQQTLSRFGCYHSQDFVDAIERIQDNVRQVANDNTYRWVSALKLPPQLIAFSTLRDAYVEQVRLIPEKEALDKETRRAWTALRWCLYNYACVCTGGHRYRSNDTRGGKRFHILVGSSNNAEAWTDGDTYIAFNVDIIKRLKSKPLKVASYLFNLLEHEIAHEGDSLECGHDEAFYQRFHDITINNSEVRQHYLHVWLKKYTTSMEKEGKTRGSAWGERYLLDRAGSGREKRGLPRLDINDDPVMALSVPEEDAQLISLQNMCLVQSGHCPQPPDWNTIIEQGLKAQQTLIDEKRKKDEAAQNSIVNVPHNEDTYEDWDDDFDNDYYAWLNSKIENEEPESEEAKNERKLSLYPPEIKALIKPGETIWLLERNAAAAGFYNEEDYLVWRKENSSDDDI